MWEVATAACVFTQPVPFELKEEASERSLTQCTFVPARNEIVTVSVEHNIVLYDAQTLQLRKQVTTFLYPSPRASSGAGGSFVWVCTALLPVLELFWVTNQKASFTSGVVGRNLAQTQTQEKESRAGITRNPSHACV